MSLAKEAYQVLIRVTHNNGNSFYIFKILNNPFEVFGLKYCGHLIVFQYEY